MPIDQQIEDLDKHLNSAKTTTERNAGSLDLSVQGKPEDPNSALWDEERKLWLDRKTKIPLRDQSPGIPNHPYVGKHDMNEIDDIADGLAVKRPTE